MTLTITTPFNKWASVSKRYKIAYGGRGGSKSFSISKILIGLSFSLKGTILCTRQTQTSMDDSVYPMFVDFIYSAGLDKYFRIKSSEIINKVSGVNFIFKGLQEWSIANVKGTYNVAICWVEEGENVTLNSWKILTPSIRGEKSEIWVSFNPLRATDTFYKIVSQFSDKLKEITFQNKKYKYYEYEDENYLITKVNYDGNNFFENNSVMIQERDICFKQSPEQFSHIWLGDIYKEQGRIFLKDKLKFYDEEDMKETFTHYTKRAIIDPAFGDKSCFTSCILYTQVGGSIYLNDSGLLRASKNQTSDEAIESFLIKNKIREVMCESNFSQKELVKKLNRHFQVKPFNVKQNKIERIVNASILIYEKVYFPLDWLNVPEGGSTSEYIETSQGRGFVALQQLLNFSDIQSENCKKDDDFSFVDFPDCLSSLMMYGNKKYEAVLTYDQSNDFGLGIDNVSREKKYLKNIKKTGYGLNN